jgi:hypothetical protein
VLRATTSKDWIALNTIHLPATFEKAEGQFKLDSQGTLVLFYSIRRLMNHMNVSALPKQSECNRTDSMLIPDVEL